MVGLCPPAAWGMKAPDRRALGEQGAIYPLDSVSQQNPETAPTSRSSQTALGLWLLRPVPLAWSFHPLEAVRPTTAKAKVLTLEAERGRDFVS